MSKTVKRYNMDVGRFGNVDNYESEHGRWVLHTDYARLEQKCYRLRKLIDGITDDYVVDHLDSELVKRIDAALSAKP